MSKEPSYIPPFTVSADAINMIAEISAQIERYAIRLEREDGLRLRKANRIKTIHSSLAIEGNTLSEDEVRDIIDGKNVVAPIRQIQEVKNAIKTYELYPTLDAFKEKDLLKAHGVMMEALVDNAGQSGPFIDFMLNEIYKTLKEHQGEPLPNKLHDKIPNKVPNKIPNKLRRQYPDLSDAVWDVYMELKEDAYASAETVGGRLGISVRMVRKHISVLREAGIIERIGGNKTGYWKMLKK